MEPLEQIRMDQAIGQELLEVIPENWEGGMLTARLVPGNGTSWSLDISIVPRPDGSSTAPVSDALEARLAHLFAAHRKAATGMIEACYIIEDRADPSIVSEFSYED